MLDREKLEAILIRRFPGAAPQQVAAAANAIMGLSAAFDRNEPARECGIPASSVRGEALAGGERVTQPEPDVEEVC
jgi:hypothetical protein